MINLRKNTLLGDIRIQQYHLRYSIICPEVVRLNSAVNITRSIESFGSLITQDEGMHISVSAGKLGLDSTLSQLVERHLLARANGTYLWASFVIGDPVGKAGKYPPPHGKGFSVDGAEASAFLRIAKVNPNTRYILRRYRTLIS